MQGAKAEAGKGRICAHSHMQEGTGGVRLCGEGQRTGEESRGRSGA